MAVVGVRRRKGVAGETSHGTIGRLGVQHAGEYGPLVQIVRGLVVLSAFLWTCVCICVTEFLGTPLYYIDRRYFNAYIAMTKRSFGITITALTEWASPTPVRVSGDKSVQGQVGLLKDGRLKHSFPDRLLLIANHQVYTDWLYLWWVTYTNRTHGHIYIILKESLKYLPLLGQGMMLYGFVFMARKWQSDKPRLQHRLQKLNAPRPGSAAGSPAYDPMWLLIFPEGTNLSPRTKRLSEAYSKKQGRVPFKHVLLPRSTGLFFCLQQLRGSVDWVYDCTIGYDGHPKGVTPDTHFTIRSTYLRKCPPKVVNLHWRRFAVSEIPLDDQQEFEAWLFERWAEKDQLMDHLVETGKFPPFEYDAESNGVVYQDEAEEANLRPAYIEGEIKLGHWVEVFNIFAVLIAFGAFIWRFT